jgi:hypothetical protein
LNLSFPIVFLMLADYISFSNREERQFRSGHQSIADESTMTQSPETEENKLEKALFDIHSGHLHRALVRLWVLAGLRIKGENKADNDLVLNSWERNTDANHRQENMEAFNRMLSGGKKIKTALARTEPLALIQALDSFLANHLPARRKSNVPYAIDGAEYWLVRIPLGPRANAPMSKQANNRAKWFHHHNIIPARLRQLNDAIRIRILDPDLATQRRLEELRGKSMVKAYLAHFTDNVKLEFTQNPAGKFFAHGLSDSGTRIRSIQAHLEIAYSKCADIVIFPELTVTPKHRRAIREWHLDQIDNQKHVPILLVSGSFHEVFENKQKVNRAEMLGSAGNPLLNHDKIRPYGDADGGAEDIDSGSCLNLLSTSMGILAMPICKDFNDAASIDWNEIGPDWCLVPSMGNESSIRAHSEQAQRLWKILFRTTSLIGNQEFEGSPVPGFAFSESKISIPIGGGMIEITINS